MRWQDHIHSDPDVLLGKPVVKGTRLAVDFILRLLAEGWSLEQILENYPSLTPESLRAVFAFAAEALRGESLSDDDLRPEYDFDFSKGERGRYYNRLLKEGLELPAGQSEDGSAPEAKFLLALRLFEQGHISSGRAAEICGMGRVEFLLMAGRSGLPVADLDQDEDEMSREFVDV